MNRFKQFKPFKRFAPVKPPESVIEAQQLPAVDDYRPAHDLNGLNGWNDWNS